jgi:hypothetical protein
LQQIWRLELNAVCRNGIQETCSISSGFICSADQAAEQDVLWRQEKADNSKMENRQQQDFRSTVIKWTRLKH